MSGEIKLIRAQGVYYASRILCDFCYAHALRTRTNRFIVVNRPCAVVDSAFSGSFLSVALSRGPLWTFPAKPRRRSSRLPTSDSSVVADTLSPSLISLNVLHSGEIEPIPHCCPPPAPLFVARR